MMYPDLAWLPQGEIQGDALGDLQTSDNRLSAYKVESKEDAEQVIIALAATRENLANLDYAVFDDAMLTSTGIVIRQQDGETPINEANKLHYDLSELTAGRLVVLARAVASGEHSRVPRKNIKVGLQQALRSGTIDEHKMKAKLLQSIQ